MDSKNDYNCNPSNIPITVTDGTATAGVDYNLPDPLIISFDGNASSEGKEFIIPVLGDEIVELDETFSVTFGDPIIDPGIDPDLISFDGVPHQVTIEDDDTATKAVSIVTRNNKQTARLP